MEARTPNNPPDAPPEKPGFTIEVKIPMDHLRIKVRLSAFTGSKIEDIASQATMMAESELHRILSAAVGAPDSLLVGWDASRSRLAVATSIIVTPDPDFEPAPKE